MFSISTRCWCSPTIPQEGGGTCRRRSRRWSAGSPHARRHRCAHHRRARAVQCHARRDPDRPPAPVSGAVRRERQSRSLAGRLSCMFGKHCGRSNCGRHRRRDVRDRAVRPLRASAPCQLRSRSDVLQFRVPAQRLSPAPTPDEPLPGTLPEPEIWARLVRALGIVDEADLEPLRVAAGQGLDAYAHAFLGAVGANPAMAKVLPFVLYETLGRHCPKISRAPPRCGGSHRRLQ